MSQSQSFQDIHNSSTIHSSLREKAPLQFTTPENRWTSWLPIVLVGVGIIILSGVVILKYSSQSNSTAQEVGEGKTEVLSSVAPVVKMITVDASGSLEKPGVYELPENSRIQDVLITAGGLSESADRNYVSKYINLSQKISDGQKIYIPFKDENNTNLNSNREPLSGQFQVSVGSININIASLDSLDTLPGVGPVTAHKIIDSRPYNSIEDLLKKKAVSNSVYQKIKDKISAL